MKDPLVVVTTETDSAVFCYRQAEPLKDRLMQATFMDNSNGFVAHNREVCDVARSGLCLNLMSSSMLKISISWI